MIRDLISYPAYRDSGVPWLGQVPERWEVFPARAAYRRKLVKNIGMIEKTVLSLSFGRIVVKPEEKLRGLVPESFETYQIVDPGNIIIRTTDLQNDQKSLRIGFSDHRGIITSAYMCLSTTDRVSAKFGYQLLNAYDLLKIIYGFGSGLRQSLDFSDIKQMPVLVPPPPEQAAIVRFLDHADRRIRRYIAAKKKLIALLDEQKQAVIHGAVTRGLNPNVRLKPSGVEWLGDVPEHWLVCPLKFLVPQVTVGIVVQPARLYADSGVPCLRSFNISSGVVTSRDLAFISPEANNANRKSQIFAGDVVVVRTGRAGIAAIVSPEFDGANCIDLLIVRKSKKILSDYLLTYLNSWPAKTDVKYRSVGAIQAHYNTATLANMVVATPPLEEQRQILDEIAPLVAVINASMTAADGQIALMREIRTRLIADVVTGKLDVRDAVGQLPDEIHEPEPLDLDDALTEGEGSEDEADLNGAAEEAEA
jgi:type I restriction enzyme, S subunit